VRVGRVGENPREDVRVGVGVGVVEFQLYSTSSQLESLSTPRRVQHNSFIEYMATKAVGYVNTSSIKKFELRTNIEN